MAFQTAKEMLEWILVVKFNATFCPKCDFLGVFLEVEKMCLTTCSSSGSLRVEALMV